MSDKKKTVRVGQYLLAKDGKTKYLKLGCKDDAPAEQKEMVERLIEAIGSDVIYVNIFDQEFKDKYDIQDFVKGSIAVELKPPTTPDPKADKKPEAKQQAKAPAKKQQDPDDEVEF